MKGNKRRSKKYKVIKSIDKRLIIKKIESFLQNREEILFSYIFGSFSENEFFNDIDLALYVDEKNQITKNPWYEIELSNSLEEILEIPVDIINLNRASDALVYRASKGILVKNNEMRLNYLITRWKKFFDFKPKIQEYIKVIKNG
ncbi:MAG: nucleotidyltransferase domain-containing protein [Methanosarcinales archaeon]